MPKKLNEKIFLHNQSMGAADDDNGFEKSKMNGKIFEVDKDVERSKRIKPEKVFQNYNKKGKKTKKKVKDKKSNFEKPQPVSAKMTKNTYKL